MKALITRLTADNQREGVLVTDWPDPGKPVGNQIRTKTVYSGVTNGTERNFLVRGNYAPKDTSLPCSMGYQMIARVIETGPDVKQWKVDQLLYMATPHAEYTVVPEDAKLIEVPPEIDPKHAALFGMASVAMNTCRTIDVRMGERVLIVGLGCIGQIASQIANSMGAKVTTCDIDQNRIDLARKIGAAEEVYNVSGENWSKHILDDSYDVVIDVAGVPDMEDKFIHAIRIKGRIILMGGRFKVNYTFGEGQNKELTIKQTGSFSGDDLANLSRMVQLSAVKIGPLIRDVVTLDDAGRIYEKLRDRPHELLGTVFSWQE